MHLSALAIMNPEAKDFFFNKQTIPKTMDERTPLPYSRDEIVNGRDGSFSKGRPCSHVLGTPLRSGFAACVHTRCALLSRFLGSSYHMHARNRQISKILPIPGPCERTSEGFFRPRSMGLELQSCLTLSLLRPLDRPTSRTWCGQVKAQID